MKNSGFALIMTLFVMVFLLVAAMSFTLSSRWSMAGTRNFMEETEAYYLALAGYDVAVRYLMDDGDSAVDFVDEEGLFHVDAEKEPLPPVISLYGGDVEIRISDEQARININRAGTDTVAKLLEYAGLEFDRRNTLLDCMADWMDPDDAHRLNGAEDEYYEDLGYRAKNAPLDTVEELMLVKDFPAGLLDGSGGLKDVSSLLTTVGDGTFNVNTASRELMEILGVSEIDIENVMRYRNAESGGLRMVPTGLRPFGFTSTAATYIRIEVEARLKGSGIRYIISAVTRRIPEGKGYRIMKVRWREDVIYS